MVYLSSLVAGALGVFELVLAGYMFHTGLPSDLKVFPPYFSTNPESFIMLLSFTIFLGLIRLQWAVSGRTFVGWLCLLAAHAVEMWALWSLALLPHFNPLKLSIHDLISQMAHDGVWTDTYAYYKYDPLTCKVLFAVPVILLFFLVSYLLGVRSV
jgi:hypothetical protein